MDIVPNEPLQERLEPEVILVPKEQARAFGRALTQSLSPFLQEINNSLGSLTGNPHHQIVKNALLRIFNVVYGLEKAREVRLKQIGPGSDFRFSEETEEEEKPKQGEVLIDRKITPKLVSALNHTVRNPLFVISGFAEISESEEAENISNACSSIENVITPLSNAQKISITTNTEGKTTIIPIRDSS